MCCLNFRKTLMCFKKKELKVFRSRNQAFWSAPSPPFFNSKHLIIWVMKLGTYHSWFYLLTAFSKGFDYNYNFLQLEPRARAGADQKGSVWQLHIRFFLSKSGKISIRVFGISISPVQVFGISNTVYPLITFFANIDTYCFFHLK